MIQLGAVFGSRNAQYGTMELSEIIRRVESMNRRCQTMSVSFREH